MNIFVLACGLPGLLLELRIIFEMASQVRILFVSLFVWLHWNTSFKR